MTRDGLVISLIGGKYKVLDLGSKEEYVCEARGKLRHKKLSSDNSFNKNTRRGVKTETKTVKLSPKVGDNVIFVVGDGVNYIEDINERENELTRPAIANIDQVLLVFAAKEPNFSQNLLDRFLIHIENENILPVIVVTKVDLLTEEELLELKEVMSYYEGIGYEVYYTSMKEDLTKSSFINVLKDNISVLAGQTGAGKSTLLNTIDPKFQIRTQEISQSLGRGKHTTRHSELHEVSGGLVADTPGFSSLDFGFMTPEELRDSYVDFVEMSNECKYRGCFHDKENNCKVKKEAEDNRVLRERYNTYLKFLNQIKDSKVKY